MNNERVQMSVATILIYHKSAICIKWKIISYFLFYVNIDKMNFIIIKFDRVAASINLI